MGLRLTDDERIAFGDDERERNRERAALLELLWPVVDDPLCEAEARQSVLAVAAESQLVTAQSWLDNHFKWSRQLSELQQEFSGPSGRVPTEVGGIAIVGSATDRPRIVCQIGDRSIGLFVLGARELMSSFSSDRIVALKPANW